MEYFHLTGKGGVTLNCAFRTPSSGSPKGTVLLSHGYAEHMGRYNEVIEFFSKQNYGVFILDHRGHGLSGGARADVEDFDDFAEDFHSFAEEVFARSGDIPLFLLGHSMGCTVLLRYLERFNQQDRYRGAVLSAPALMVSQKFSPLLIAVSNIISSVLPGLPLGALDVDGLSRDKGVVREYMADPLTYSKKTKARMGTHLLKAKTYVEKELEKITLPLLILHGEEDRIIDPESSKYLSKSTNSRDVTLKLFPHLYHEILQEPEKQEIFNTVFAWIEDRLPGT